MTESMPTKSRLLRTGTLVLIAVVLLIGGSGLVVWLPYHQNQTAIAEVERLGGTTYTVIVRPKWLPSAVDNEYLWVFDRAFSVDLADTHVSDDGLDCITALRNLWHLNLANTQVTDAGLEHLAGLSALRHLEIQNTNATTVGIEKLTKVLPECSISWIRPSK